MNLILIWFIFIVVTSNFESLGQFYYLLSSSLMFLITFCYNQVKPTLMSLKDIVWLLSIPNLVAWYVAFIYNDFLNITSISREVFLSLLVLYTYSTFYTIQIISKSYNSTRNRVKSYLEVF